jgi:3-hydroxyacyl-[acyl-carrier-protein] dehydratase
MCSSGDEKKGRARMPPAPLVDPATIDTSRVLVDREGIRRFNPQRFEMEQLSAIVLLDEKNKLIIGYKDVEPGEFWVRGHMPDYPLMPGVLICEAAAQLSSYFCKATKLIETGFVGFGGMDRLVLIGKGVRLHRRHTIFEVQGFVAANMVFHGRVFGVTLTSQEEGPS